MCRNQLLCIHMFTNIIEISEVTKHIMAAAYSSRFTVYSILYKRKWTSWSLNTISVVFFEQLCHRSQWDGWLWASSSWQRMCNCIITDCNISIHSFNRWYYIYYIFHLSTVQFNQFNFICWFLELIQIMYHSTILHFSVYSRIMPIQCSLFHIIQALLLSYWLFLTNRSSFQSFLFRLLLLLAFTCERWLSSSPQQ